MKHLLVFGVVLCIAGILLHDMIDVPAYIFRADWHSAKWPHLAGSSAYFSKWDLSCGVKILGLLKFVVIGYPVYSLRSACVQSLMMASLTF